MQAQVGLAPDATGGGVGSVPMVGSDGQMERLLGAKAGGAGVCGKVEVVPTCGCYMVPGEHGTALLYCLYY